MGDTFDDSQAQVTERRFTQSPHLVVLFECDRPLSGSARYSLDGIGAVEIGRGEARQVRRYRKGDTTILEVKLPGRSLSKAHARLVRVATSWVIEDLDSKNGTFINGCRSQRAALEPNATFDLGHTLFRVNPVAATSPDLPLDIDWAGSPNSDSGLATLDPLLGERFTALGRVAGSDIPILLRGDSGTGKEVLARWIHLRMGRTGELIAVNCGAIAPTLVESTLFGHVRGAFSGAVRDAPGVFRAARGGTLLLDEIADLPKSSQAALLRALQEREVTPVGATQPVAVDVRLVAASHIDLEAMVARGEFREDLYARLAGFVVDLPALRDRRDDFGILVATLLSRLALERASSVGFTPEAGRALLAYDWPLNVRELHQCLAVSLALAQGGPVEPAHLPAQVLKALDCPVPNEAPPVEGDRDERLQMELLAQLARHHGNVADVSRAMGKARMQIHRWCKRFAIDPQLYRK